MNKFNERFRMLKEESDLSSKELSQELGIAPSTLSYYLKDREPNYDMLIKIADYFNVTIDWLVGRTDARSSVYAALDEEITNTIIKNDVANISKEDVTPLSIYKSDYLKAQEKLIELMSFYYTLLHKLEDLERMHPDIDYSQINDSLTENFIEVLEYQIDIIEDAHWTVLASTSNVFFEYYFNSLLRIDLVLNSYKMVVCRILEISASNYDGNSDQLSVVTEFLKKTEKYAQNCISNTELSSYFERLGL